MFLKSLPHDVQVTISTLSDHLGHPYIVFPQKRIDPFNQDACAFDTVVINDLTDKGTQKVTMNLDITFPYDVSVLPRIILPAHLRFMSLHLHNKVTPFVDVSKNPFLHLRKLHLQNCSVKNVNAVIKKLTSLEVLVISGKVQQKEIEVSHHKTLRLLEIVYIGSINRIHLERNVKLKNVKVARAYGKTSNVNEIKVISCKLISQMNLKDKISLKELTVNGAGFTKIDVSKLVFLRTAAITNCVLLKTMILPDVICIINNLPNLERGKIHTFKINKDNAQEYIKSSCLLHNLPYKKQEPRKSKRPPLFTAEINTCFPTLEDLIDLEEEPPEKRTKLLACEFYFEESLPKELPIFKPLQEPLPTGFSTGSS